MPTLLYMAWLGIARAQAEARGESRLPQFGEAPWPILLGLGVVLLAGVLLGSVFTRGRTPTDAVYVPPAAQEDGSIHPGHFILP